MLWKIYISILLLNDVFLNYLLQYPENLIIWWASVMMLKIQFFYHRNKLIKKKK